MPRIQPIRSKYPFEVLTASELRALQEATLSVMDQVGVRFPSEKALKVFAEHGAQVDFDSQVVRMSPDFVLEQLQHAPREYRLGGREADTELQLGSGNSYFSTDGCGTETIDPTTRQPRPSTKADVAMMARVSDYLSSISFYWPIVSAQDFGKISPLHELDAAYRNTSKHVQTETVIGEPMARYAVRMTEVIADSSGNLASNAPLSSLVCTIAPLNQDREGIEGAMVFAEAGLPVGFMGMPNMGSTAPAVPGGALVVANAETVSAMVLMQLVAPGAPVFQSILVSGMNPQSAEYIVSSPEKYLCNAAAVQISHDWGVPSLAGSFGVDSVQPDSWQLGRDSVYTALLIGMAGTDLSIGLGLLKASTLLIPEQILFDDEIYHSHRIQLEGLTIDAETLAVDVIAEVGPHGHYLSSKHTRQNLRNRWIPRLTHPIMAGGEDGHQDIRARARAEFECILSEHVPTPLDGHQERELDQLLISAGNEIGE